jgi:hypothetical protein
LVAGSVFDACRDAVEAAEPLPRMKLKRIELMRLSDLCALMMFGGAVAAAHGAQVRADDFQISFAAGSRDAAGRFAGGTEMRLLTAHAGGLYAGNGC